MLPGAGFGNDAFFAHTAGQQRLAEGVVDFVRAGVQQIFPFQKNLSFAVMFGQVLSIVEQRWSPGVLF